jgi:prevent-host-death family protein
VRDEETLPTTGPAAAACASGDRSGHWALQDAKVRFSELVRRVRNEGRQHVTVHGRDEVVVSLAEEFRRLKGGATGVHPMASVACSTRKFTSWLMNASISEVCFCTLRSPS